MDAKEYAEYVEAFENGVEDLEDGTFSTGRWTCPECNSERECPCLDIPDAVECDNCKGTYTIPTKFHNCTGCENETCELYGVEPEPESSFSWSSCDVCGSHLGGDREDVIGWLKGARKHGFTEDYQWSGSVCVDCVYFNEYGRLDDMTMLEVDKSESA